MAIDPNKKKDEQEVKNPPASTDTPPAPQPVAEVSPEEQQLVDSNNQLLAATKAANQVSINSVADFIGEYERQKQAKIAEDENLRKREEAYRYISGLGDTLSGIANLVGVAHGAANQPQKFNSSEIMRKAEEARAKRKQDMEDLDKKIQEQRARLSQVKSAASLQEAQLQAKAQKEQLELRRKNAEAERAQANADRSFAEKQRQFNENQERLTEQAAAENASREAIKQKELEDKAAARAEKRAADPEFMSKTLQLNVTGIRDEIARNAGYDDYNDYLQHKKYNVAEGKTRRETRKTRKEINRTRPEDMELLELLKTPTALTEEDIRMLAGASKVFARAINGNNVAAIKASEDKNL